MSGGFNPTTNQEWMPVQTMSNGFQVPFFFGGSQIPSALLMKQGSFSGSGLYFHKGTSSKTHLGDLDFTTKRGDEVFHRKDHNIKVHRKLPFEGEGLHKRVRLKKK